MRQELSKGEGLRAGASDSANDVTHTSATPAVFAGGADGAVQPEAREPGRISTWPAASTAAEPGV